MSIARRDVLKILTAVPFLGVTGASRAGQTLGFTSRICRVFEEPFLSEIDFPALRLLE